MIPKIIHYFWFGGNPKPKIVENCLNSWKRFFPDYEILEWNETNYDINKCPYLREAYECRKWAFVSDYARFDVLYQYGGIYFDTDVEVLKKFPSSLFDYQAFTGVESTNIVAPGLVFACESGWTVLREILDNYEKSHFLEAGNQNLMTVNERVTSILQKKGFHANGQFQVVEGLAIFPSEYFCGYNLDLQEPEITENTITIHHYTWSWASGRDLAHRNARKLLRRIIGKKGYMTVQALVRRLKHKK